MFSNPTLAPHSCNVETLQQTSTITQHLNVCPSKIYSSLRMLPMNRQWLTLTKGKQHPGCAITFTGTVPTVEQGDIGIKPLPAGMATMHHTAMVLPWTGVRRSVTHAHFQAPPIPTRSEKGISS